MKKKKRKIEKKEKRKGLPSKRLRGVKKCLPPLGPGFEEHTYVFVTIVCIPNEYVGNEKDYHFTFCPLTVTFCSVGIL